MIETKPVHLSVVLATHNEEACLAETLSAISDLADEIVIVDGESTDKTVEIARSFKAKVISTTNKSNFHINKNMAIHAASGELILQLDADEVVDAELHQEINGLKEQQVWLTVTKDRPVAWSMRRKNFFLSTWLSKGGQYPDVSVRLFIAGKALLPAKDVHELLQVDGKIEQLQGHLLHYANPTFADYVRKANRYTSFSAQQWFDKKTPITFKNTIYYCMYLPFLTTAKLFIRHRGYVDGVAGCIFAAGSGLHFLLAYIKLWELYETNKH